MEVTQACLRVPPATMRAGVEVPAGLVEETLERTGVAVSFFHTDGTPYAGAATEAANDDGLRRLVLEAVQRNEDRSSVADGRLRAAWPIRLRSRTALVAAGELVLADAEGKDLGERLLAAVAEAVRAAVAAAGARAESEAASESLLQNFEEISLLHHLGEVLRVNRPVAELLEYVCGELRETLDAEAVAAYLTDMDEAGPATLVAGRLPFSGADLPRVVAHLLDGLETDQHVVVNNHCQEDPVLAAISIALDRVVLVPLPMHEGPPGALLAVNRAAGEFGSPDAKLIRSAATSSAIFIENRRLYREAQEMMLDLVRALVSSVDAKDPYTCGHSERVAITCRRIATQLHLTPDEVEYVYLAGLLHDIGKIGTPEHILRKEGRLEPEERQIMIRHCEIGGRILAGIRRLDPIRDAVLHHHEHLDGSGYPSGLKGDQIPLFARIVSMADAFDAMTSNRPYRPMLPLDQVRHEIENHVGTQFDAPVANALLGMDLASLMREFMDRPTSVCVP